MAGNELYKVSQRACPFGSKESDMSEIERLKSIVEKLRAEDGCPWDRAQTHGSLKPACIEEAAEVIRVGNKAILGGIACNACAENG